ncbi:hypothetical protein Tco_0290204 [Tanacetum coccineum]
MESSNSNLKERELQLSQLLVKQRQSYCMYWLEQLEIHLRDLYLDNSSHAIDAFKPAFHTFFGEEHETFRFKMFYNLDQLRLQLERENLHEVNAMTCLEALRTQFKEFFASKGVNSSDHLNQCWQQDFEEYTLCEPETYRRGLLRNLEKLEWAIFRAVIAYGVLRMKEDEVNALKQTEKSLNKAIPHEHEIDKIKLAVKILGNDITHAMDADIRPNDQVPFADVQLTAQHNVLANEQQHFVQSEPIYDTHLLEKVDRNTIPDSTNMCHRGGEIEQNAKKCQVSCPLLDPSFDNMTIEFSNQSLESENIFLKKTVAQLQKDFSRMEAHCVNMELKYQNQALKDGQRGQILNETSNKGKIKKEIEVLEKINIELEYSVAKLLAENEKLHKENEHLKQTYKDLYDSVKTTRVQTKDQNDSLIAQINSKTVENADLKAQIQEKVFANAALKNELRKLKGNSVDTKFAKPSILRKPVLQPPRNQSVVRQPNAFKSERPNFLKPRFASQVDVNKVLSKPVTPHYLPKVRKSAPAKPHHVNAPSSSRNSQKESYGSNDMAHNYYLEEAKKKTQNKNRNLEPREMPSAKTHHTPNACTPKPRSNNQTSMNWHASKSCEETLKAMQNADHSRNPSSFSDFKHFVCKTCQKCVFNATHDACITKFLKEVNSRAKIQPNKTRNSNKPVDPTSHTQKPGRKIVTGHSFSPNKSSVVHEKTNTPRSCLRWIPTGTLNLSAGTFCNPEKERLGVCLKKAPLLKEKKSVRFSALYLQKKRNLLLGKKVKATLKSAWTEKDQIDNLLKERRKLKDGGEVKEFQRSFSHSDTERLSRSDEVLKLKNFKKDATLKLSKSTNQERYEHVGPEVASSQDGKVSRWRRDCAWLMISRCSRSQCQIQVQGTSSIQKSMITTTYSQENVKRTS